MELFSLKQMPKAARIGLLRELGFDSDGIFVLDGAGEKVFDRYIEEQVRVDNMLILPGSAIILDNNPLSVASYLEEFGDVL